MCPDLSYGGAYEICEFRFYSFFSDCCLLIRNTPNITYVSVRIYIALILASWFELHLICVQSTPYNNSNQHELVSFLCDFAKFIEKSLSSPIFFSLRFSTHYLLFLLFVHFPRITKHLLVCLPHIIFHKNRTEERNKEPWPFIHILFCGNVHFAMPYPIQNDNNECDLCE